MVNYAEALDLEFEFKFVDACIKDIVDDTLSSKYVLTRMQPKLGRSIRFPKFYLKTSYLIFEIDCLRARGRKRNSLNTSHLD